MVVWKPAEARLDFFMPSQARFAAITPKPSKVPDRSEDQNSSIFDRAYIYDDRVDVVTCLVLLRFDALVKRDRSHY